MNANRKHDTLLMNPDYRIVVEIRKEGARWNAYDHNDHKVSGWISTGQKQKAFNAKKALKRCFYKDGRPYWRMVESIEYANTKSFQSPTVDVPSVSMHLIKSDTSGIEYTEGTYHPFVSQEETMEFIRTSYSLKPKTVFIDELHWKHLIRTVIRGKNTCITGMQGSGKTLVARTVGKVLGRSFFIIPLGETQDPKGFLLGNTHYDKETGTVFYPSRFIRAIQTPGAVILLDELSRAHPDAHNILMPALDETQRYVVLDETRENAIIRIADGVTFIATANIGAEFTATRVMDRSITDRFTFCEMPMLTKEEEAKLLIMLYPTVNSDLLTSVAEITSATRDDWKSDSPKLSTGISTRTAVEIASLLYDGFTLVEAARVAIFPFFPTEGGLESERTYVTQIVQKYCDDGSTTTLFTPDDIKSAT